MGGGETDRDERPVWARRMRAERQALGWSQADAVRALARHADGPIPGNASLLRNWKRWEAGDAEPDGFYKPLIAKTFGTVSTAFFPRPGHRDADLELLARGGMDTLELVARLRTSDVSAATLGALRITADRLCAEYPYASPEQPVVAARSRGTAAHCRHCCWSAVSCERPWRLDFRMSPSPSTTLRSCVT